MATLTTLALDAMGGDNGPSIVIDALTQALTTFTEIHFIVVGDEIELQLLLRQAQLLGHPRVTLKHASQTVTMTDKPGYSLRAKPDSSMRVALELVATGEAKACISAGNTGALMTNAYFTLKTRSEEHTSELQSRPHLVCRLLLEKKKKKKLIIIHIIN